MTVIFPTVTAMCCALLLSTFFSFGLEIKQSIIKTHSNNQELHELSHYTDHGNEVVWQLSKSEMRLEC